MTSVAVLFFFTKGQIEVVLMREHKYGTNCIKCCTVTHHNDEDRRNKTEGASVEDMMG